MRRSRRHAGRLDLDHVGAEVRQHLAGPRTGEHAAEIEDADAGERAHASVLWAETYET